MSVKLCDNENARRLGFVLRFRDNVTLVKALVLIFFTASLYYQFCIALSIVP